MKLLIITLLFTIYHMFVRGDLNSCLRRCSNMYSVHPPSLLVCRQTCYQNATRDGYKQTSLSGCLTVCNAITNEEEQKDCRDACEVLFPNRKRGRPTNPTTQPDLNKARRSRGPKVLKPWEKQPGTTPWLGL